MRKTKKKIVKAAKPAKLVPVKPPVREGLPHSWMLRDWERVASHVAPNTLSAAKHLIRSNRDALVEAGALSRIGRELVVYGPPYSAWMFSEANRKLVADFQPPMNRDGAA